MLIDIHVHATGRESASEIVEGMDTAGLDQICLFAPPPETEALGTRTGTMQENHDWLAGIAAAAPERILPFAWIEPTLDGAPTEVERVVRQLGFRGIKMIPKHWYPTDQSVFPVYERIEAMDVPALFHSGILFLYDDCSRYCQPVLFEALLHFPKLRFALAHISWPWVDECLAVYGRFRAAVRGQGIEPQMWIDTTPGTPPAWRKDALHKAFCYADQNHILWGSDSTGTGLEHAAETLVSDQRILRDELGLSEETERAWMGENAMAWLGR